MMALKPDLPLPLCCPATAPPHLFRSWSRYVTDYPSYLSRSQPTGPGFRALSITVRAATVVDPNVGARALDEACTAMLTADVPWAEAHLAAWGELFKKFGAKPQRTPCSAEALRKRVARDGNLPTIDPVVDLYNAISIRYAIPVGGENLLTYEGATATGSSRWQRAV